MFAALNAASGKVSGQCYPHHRHQEFIKFLRRLDSEYEPDLELHLIMDNYGTHKHEKVRRFLDRHRRFKVHYIPTSSSWLNLVERWFAELSDQAVIAIENVRMLTELQAQTRALQRSVEEMKALSEVGQAVEGGAGRIHRAIQVAPLAFYPDVRLVNAPAVIGGLEP